MTPWQTHKDLLDILDSLPESSDGQSHKVVHFSQLKAALQTEDFVNGRKLVFIENAKDIEGYHHSISTRTLKKTTLDAIREITHEFSFNVNIRHYDDQVSYHDD